MIKFNLTISVKPRILTYVSACLQKRSPKESTINVCRSSKIVLYYVTLPSRQVWSNPRHWPPLCQLAYSRRTQINHFYARNSSRTDPHYCSEHCSEPRNAQHGRISTVPAEWRRYQTSESTCLQWCHRWAADQWNICASRLLPRF